MRHAHVARVPTIAAPHRLRRRFDDEHRGARPSSSDRRAQRGVAAAGYEDIIGLLQDLGVVHLQQQGAELEFYFARCSTISTMFSNWTFSSASFALSPSVNMVVQKGHETAITSG